MATKNVILKDSSSNELRPETVLTQVKDASGNDLFTQTSGVISTTTGNSINGASINDASIGAPKLANGVFEGLKDSQGNLITENGKIKSSYLDPSIITSAKIHSISKSGKFTGSGVDDQYTGLSYTIPANCMYFIGGKLEYESNKPSFISINTSSSSWSAQMAQNASAENSAALKCETFGYNNTNSSMTVYLWGRWGAAGQNGVEFYGFYITTN